MSDFTSQVLYLLGNREPLIYYPNWVAAGRPPVAGAVEPEQDPDRWMTMVGRTNPTKPDPELATAVAEGRAAWRPGFKIKDISFFARRRGFVNVRSGPYCTWREIRKSEIIVDGIQPFRLRESARLTDGTWGDNPLRSICYRLKASPWYKQHGGFVTACEWSRGVIDVLWVCDHWPDANSLSTHHARPGALRYDNRLFQQQPSGNYVSRLRLLTPSEYEYLKALPNTTDLPKRLRRFEHAYRRHLWLKSQKAKYTVEYPK